MEMDFLECLGPDTSAIVFTLLDDPADLARASAVSRSWRRFVSENGFSKIQCLRACPEVAIFTRIQQLAPPAAAAAASSTRPRSEEEQHEHEHVRVGVQDVVAAADAEHLAYMHLSHGLLSPYQPKDCIAQCIGASSTDNFPEETIDNTLEPIDRDEMRPSYWSSAGHADPAATECLLYSLQSHLCLIDQINIQPFKAFFQFGDPIYSANHVRFRMGYPKSSPLPLELLVSDDNEGQLTGDDNYIWTYTSPEFPMSQENVLQPFKLPRPVLCIGGVVKIELLGRIQKQTMDGLYYVCVSHVQILGNPLSRELGVSPTENGVVLKYCPDPRRSSVCQGDSSGDDGCSSPSKWRDFATRIWHSGTARGIGLNQALSRLFGAPSQFVGDEAVSDDDDDDDDDEEEEDEP